MGALVDVKTALRGGSGARDFFAFRDHWQHRLADRFFAYFAEFFFEAVNGNDGFGHGAMTAGAADIVVKPFHDVAGAFDVTDVAHGNNHAIVDQARDNTPVHVFNLQAKLGHLRNDVFAIDFAEVNYREAILDFQPAERAAHRF